MATASTSCLTWNPDGEGAFRQRQVREGDTFGPDQSAIPIGVWQTETREPKAAEMVSPHAPMALTWSSSNPRMRLSFPPVEIPILGVTTAVVVGMTISADVVVLKIFQKRGAEAHERLLPRPISRELIVTMISTQKPAGGERAVEHSLYDLYASGRPRTSVDAGRHPGARCRSRQTSSCWQSTSTCAIDLPYQRAPASSH